MNAVTNDVEVWTQRHSSAGEIIHLRVRVSDLHDIPAKRLPEDFDEMTIRALCTHPVVLNYNIAAPGREFRNLLHAFHRFFTGHKVLAASLCDLDIERIRFEPKHLITLGSLLGFVKLNSFSFQRNSLLRQEDDPLDEDFSKSHLALGAFSWLARSNITVNGSKYGRWHMKLENDNFAVEEKSIYALIAFFVRSLSSGQNGYLDIVVEHITSSSRRVVSKAALRVIHSIKVDTYIKPSINICDRDASAGTFLVSEKRYYCSP